MLSNQIRPEAKSLTVIGIAHNRNRQNKEIHASCGSRTLHLQSRRPQPRDFDRSSDTEAVNPYDPPKTDSRSIASSDLGFVGTITSRFLFTPTHLIDTLERFRSQQPGRRLWRWFRYFAAFIFLLVAIAGLFVPQYWGSAFMVALTIFIFFPHKIDEYLSIRNFRKNPHYNAEQSIYLSDEGFRTESEIEQTNMKWSAFTHAVIFDDGVLLYRGPNVVNWIPDATLNCDDGASRIRRLLTAKITTNHAVNRSGRQRVF